LPAATEFTLPTPSSHNALLYTYEGDIQIGEARAPLAQRAAGVLSVGERVYARAGERGARFLLLAAKPLREPVVQYGPFVMNTREEIEQAIADYREGRLASAA
jgi:quercetin 2,3-dioxygenase